MTLTLSPAQPFTLAYGNPPTITAADYAHPGALVVSGRENVDLPLFHDIAAGGGTVLAYVDAIVRNPVGTYHAALFGYSSHGAAVGEWPGPVPANGTGNLADFRTTSTMHATSASNPSWTKLEAVLEQIVAENPHISGFLADDLGSRSWFDGFAWETWGATDQAAYRAGAIAVAQAFRRVCDRHGLLLVVNGTWQTLDSNGGGGYPDQDVHGLSLADGGVVEHHARDAFWTAYVTGTQWGTAALTAGEPLTLVLASDSTELDDWNTSGLAAYTANHPSGTYDDGVSPWGSFHATGLPPASLPPPPPTPGGPTVTFGSSSEAPNYTGGSATSVTLAAPAGVAEGDVLIAVLHIEQATVPTVTLPAGWTQVAAAAGSAPLAMVVCWKRAGTSEPASYDFTWPDGAWATGIIHRFVGAVTTGTPVTGATAQYFTGTSAPSVAYTAGDGLGVWVYTCNTEGLWITPPDGWESHGVGDHSSLGNIATRDDTEGASSTGSTTTPESGGQVIAALTVLAPPLPPPPPNVPPTADAGPDQTVDTGVRVYLHGVATDTDGNVAGSWAQTSGTAVTLAGFGANRSFISPDAAGDLVFTFTATDDAGATDTDTVTVTVAPSTTMHTLSLNLVPLAGGAITGTWEITPAGGSYVLDGVLYAGPRLIDNGGTVRLPSGDYVLTFGSRSRGVQSWGPLPFTLAADTVLELIA